MAPSSIEMYNAGVTRSKVYGYRILKSLLAFLWFL